MDARAPPVPQAAKDAQGSTTPGARPPVVDEVAPAAASRAKAVGRTLAASVVVDPPSLVNPRSRSKPRPRNPHHDVIGGPVWLISLC